MTITYRPRGTPTNKVGEALAMTTLALETILTNPDTQDWDIFLVPGDSPYWEEFKEKDPSSAHCGYLDLRKVLPIFSELADLQIIGLTPPSEK